jgi:hypothetical protein
MMLIEQIVRNPNSEPSPAGIALTFDMSKHLKVFIFHRALSTNTSSEGIRMDPINMMEEKDGPAMTLSIPQYLNEGNYADDARSTNEAPCPQIVTSIPALKPSKSTIARSASSAAAQPQANLHSSNALEKRRRCNRMSAQRWRMRKRSKFADLQDQIQTLTKVHDELKLEKIELQNELRAQLALSQAEAASMNSSLAATRRVEIEKRELGRNLQLRDLLSRMPACHAQSHFSGDSFFSSQALRFRASSNQEPPYFLSGGNVFPRPIELTSSLASLLSDGSRDVSRRAEIMAILREATASYFTTLDESGRKIW